MEDIEKIFSRFRLAVQFLLEKSIVKSQRELAKELGLKDSSMSGIMNGRSNPTLEQAAYLVLTYDINLRYLFYGELPIQFKGNEETSKHSKLLEEISSDIYLIKDKLNRNGF